MIDVAIKYFIADLCIDVFFDRLFENFNLAESFVPQVGDFYSRVTHNLHHEVYYNCRVTSVEKIPNSIKGYIVYISFEKVESEFDDDDDDEIDDEVREYVREITGNDTLSDAEADALVAEGILDEVDGDSDDDDDYYDDDDDEITDTVDLVETDDPNLVGVSTLFFTFIK